MRKSMGMIAFPEDVKSNPQPKSAFDTNFDPYAYQDRPEGQHVIGQSFADLRDEMNTRRRDMARRMTR